MPHDCFEDALKEDVRRCGGTLVVAKALYGAAIDERDARIKLSNALNPDRPEKPSLAEVLQIMRMARARGGHAAMQYLAHELSYAPLVPVEPRDEAAELQRALVDGMAELRKGFERLERLQAATPGAAPLQTMYPRAVP